MLLNSFLRSLYRSAGHDKSSLLPLLFCPNRQCIQWLFNRNNRAQPHRRSRYHRTCLQICPWGLWAFGSCQYPEADVTRSYTWSLRATRLLLYPLGMFRFRSGTGCRLWTAKGAYAHHLCSRECIAWNIDQLQSLQVLTQTQISWSYSRMWALIPYLLAFLAILAWDGIRVDVCMSLPSPGRAPWTRSDLFVSRMRVDCQWKWGQWPLTGFSLLHPQDKAFSRRTGRQRSADHGSRWTRLLKVSQLI